MKSGPNSSRAFASADDGQRRNSSRRRRATATRCSISRGYIAARLERAGISAIEDLGLCTYAEPERFFSYRRMTKLGETDYGRHINAIALDE